MVGFAPQPVQRQELDPFEKCVAQSAKNWTSIFWETPKAGARVRRLVGLCGTFSDSNAAKWRSKRGDWQVWDSGIGNRPRPSPWFSIGWGYGSSGRESWARSTGKRPPAGADAARPALATSLANPHDMLGLTDPATEAGLEVLGQPRSIVARSSLLKN